MWIVKENLGKYLRDRRVAAHMSLRAAAERMGVSHVFLGEVERGKKALPPERYTSVERAVPGVCREDLEALALESALPRSVQLTLREAGPQYVEMGMLLYRRARERSLSIEKVDEVIKLLAGESV